jgi:hypothetical protein
MVASKRGGIQVNFRTVRQHFADHQLRMVGCVFAAMLVIAAAFLSLPVLAVLGALMCGTMMIAMVWMMVGMGTKHRR